VSPHHPGPLLPSHSPRPGEEGALITPTLFSRSPPNTPHREKRERLVLTFTAEADTIDWMTRISVSISDEAASRLENLARSAGISSSALLRLCVEEWLKQPDRDFRSAADYVLAKNAALYRRLS
jgi:predicted DNA-binding protein